MKKKNSEANKQAKWMDGFHFTQDDLEANRVGALSEGQREWFGNIALDRRSLGKTLGVVGVGLGLFVGPIVLCVYSSPVNQIDSSTFMTILAALAWPLVGAAFSFINARKFDSIAADPDSRAESMAGTVKIRVDEGIYQIRINQTRVNGNASGLINGDAYVIYYEPRSRLLLSAERLEQ
jgi:hypothetical protein